MVDVRCKLKDAQRNIAVRPTGGLDCFTHNMSDADKKSRCVGHSWL